MHLYEANMLKQNELVEKINILINYYSSCIYKYNIIKTIAEIALVILLIIVCINQTFAIPVSVMGLITIIIGIFTEEAYIRSRIGFREMVSLKKDIKMLPHTTDMIKSFNRRYNFTVAIYPPKSLQMD